MSNGQIEIHDPFSGHNGIAKNTESDQKSTSESTEDMVEFRILMAYAQRRRPKQPTKLSVPDPPSTPNGNSNGSPLLQTEEATAEKKKTKKKKIWKHLPKVLTCLKPQTKDDENYRSAPVPEKDEEEDPDSYFRSGAAQEDELEHVANRLTEISDEIHFEPSDIETDCPDDDVERVIGLILREAGDQLYEQELKGTSVGAELLGNYSFFARIITTLLDRMGLSNTETIGPTVSPKTQIAVTCEATSRLSVLDTLPTNRLLGHGARYLKDHFSSWAVQQGGYEKAFEDEDEDEDDDDDDDEVH